MKKIILCKGLPASGKSTWAKEFIADKKDWVRINNDDLNAMMFGEAFSDKGGSTTDSVRLELVDYFMTKKKNIIIDNTNLHPKHHDYFVELLAEYNDGQKEVKSPEIYALDVKDFTNVSLNECLKRNKARANPVPEKVIRMMHTQYIKPTQKVVTQDKTLPKAIIVDIDGTIATMNGRSPYDATKYYTDEPIEDMVDLVKMYLANDHKLIFLTGRHEAGRAVTVKWLKDKCNIHAKHYDLLMRKDDDKSPDYEYKELMFNTHVKDKFYVPVWFEDRIRNVMMAREKLGINALQCGDGDF